MKNLFALLFLLIAPFCFSQDFADHDQHDEAGIYNVAVFDFYPLTYINEEGEHSGFMVELLDRFARDNDITFNYIQMPFFEGVERLRNGEIDLITNFAYSEERDEYADFTINSVLNSHGAVYVSLDNEDINSILDMDGKRVGVIKDDINGENFDQYRQSFDIEDEFVEYIELEDLIEAVENKEVDAAILSFVIAVAFNDRIKSTPILFSPVTTHFAIPEGVHEDLLRAIDRQILRWRADDDGYYYELYNKYFIVQSPYEMPVWLKYFLALIGIVITLVVLWILLLNRQIAITRKRVVLNETKYQNLFDNMTSGFALHEMIYDEEDNPVNYKYLEANPAFGRLTGLNEKEMIGQNVLDILPGTEKYWIETAARVAETGESVFYENYSSELNKYYETYIFSPEKGQFAIVFNDITDRKVSEKRLRENEEKLRITFENIGDAILVFDTNLEVTMMNDASSKIIHWKNDCCVGKHADDLFTKEHFFYEGQTMADLLFESMSKRKTLTIKDAKFHCTGDRDLCLNHEPRDFYIEDSISPIIDDDNETQGVVIVFRDVTEKVETEIKTKELEDKLVQSQKMEALGQFSGGIAHDFNNIVTAINGYTDLALERADHNDEKMQKYLRNIKAAGERSAELTKKILAFSRQQIIKTEVIDINKTISVFLDLTNRITGEDIEVIENFQAKQRISANVNQIERIILNLLSNAKDAINERTQIASEKKIIIETNDRIIDGVKYVEISVSDSGIGIKEENLDKIFEPFFTTKQIEKGSGMGLATVYGIVKQNDGIINVYSEINSGTTFKILWPASDDKHIILTTGEKKTVRPGREKLEKVVLFVEDEDHVRNVAEEFLSEKGFIVYTASNGKDALEKFDFEEIDLIVTDVIMPKMNGKEFIDEVKKTQPDIEVLFTSGYTRAHIVENGILTNGIEFLSKPYDLSELLEKIDEILGNTTI